MAVYLFDTETTGVKEPALVEAAWIKLEASASDVDDHFCARYNPGKPIGFGAMAVHHICNEDVADAPPAATFKLPEDCEFIVGHNIDFDWQVIGKPDVKRICTLAMARKKWPDLDSHILGALVYFLAGPVAARRMLRDAHSALVDARMCGMVLQLLDDPSSTWQDLWQRSERDRIPDRMTFGKHAGTLIADVPADYKAWLLRQADLDIYLRRALES